MKRILQVAFIAALTVFLLWLFLRNADFAVVWAILKSTSPLWLLAALAVNVGALVFRTLRWRILLDPDTPPPFYATFFATTVGYMLSAMLPVRAADVARPALLSRRTEHRFSGALGTVVIERMLDMMSVLVLFGYFTIRRWNEYAHDPRTAALWNYVMRPAAVTGCAVIALVATILAVFYFFGGAARRGHEWLARWVPHRFRDSWTHFFDTFVETLEILKRRAALGRVLLTTAGIWLCLTGQVALAAVALDRHLPYDSSFFIAFAGTLGLAVPTPGGIGGAHKAVQFVLTRFYAFDVDTSVAAAVLFHLVGNVPVIVTGLTLFVREGMKWRDVTE